MIRNILKKVAEVAIIIVVMVVTAATLTDTASVDAASSNRRCSTSCPFNTSKDGYSYYIVPTANYYCSRGWPSWGCGFIQGEAMARVSPGSLSGVWSLGCGNIHSFSAVITGYPPPPAPVNGACGSSNGQTLTSAPTTGLCSVGNASTPGTTASGWSWTCSGANGGSTASCSAGNGCDAGEKYCSVDGLCIPSGSCCSGTMECNGGCIIDTGTCTTCGTGQKLCAGQCIPNSQTCGGDDDNPSCAANEKMCAGQCILDSADCDQSRMISAFYLSPGFVESGDQCVAEWVAHDPTGLGTVISCTLNGSTAAASSNATDLPVGVHTLNCTDGITSESATTNCRLIPNFEEF